MLGLGNHSSSTKAGKHTLGIFREPRRPPMYAGTDRGR